MDLAYHSEGCDLEYLVHREPLNLVRYCHTWLRNQRKAENEAIKAQRQMR